MKATSAVLLAAAGASLSSATPTPQVYSNISQSTETSFPCPGPDGNFCVGDSLATLLSCTAGIAKPAVDCGDQLAGQSPIGSQEASCYQSSPVSGDAACTKNCMVYPLNGNPYPVPGECKPADAESSAAPSEPMDPQEPMEPMGPMFPMEHSPETEHLPDTAPAPSYPSAEVSPSYPSAEAPPAEAPPSYPSTETPPAEASEDASPPPMESMPADLKPPFPFKLPGPMFNMTLPPAMPSPSVEATQESETSPTPPSIPMPPMMPPAESPPQSGPPPEVFSKPLVQVSSPSAPEVFSKPLFIAPSGPPALEAPSPTPAVPTSPVLEVPSAPPAPSSVEGPPALPSPPAPPALPAPISAPPAMPSSPAPPAVPTPAAAPPAFSLPPFFSHIIGNWIHPPASSIPLPTTDMIASSTIPFKPLTHSYPSPAPAPPGPAYTYSTSPDFSLLPKATLPPYITTVTVGTKTQYHTIFSDCGNGTMVFGSSTITLPTGSAPNEVPLWHASNGGSLPPLPTITTVPCSEASGWNNTALYTPKKTSASYSYIATLPASATATPNSLFSQGDGYDHSGGASSGKKMSGLLIAGLMCGIAAMAL